MAIALTLFGIGLAILFGTAALARFRTHPDHGAWLAALTVALAGQMLANVGLASGAILAWPHLAQLHVPFAFAMGPLLYLHVRGSVRKDALQGRPLPITRTLAHFLPSLVTITVLLPFYASDAAAKRTYLTAALERYPIEWRLRQALLVAQLGIYVFASWRLTRRLSPGGDRFSRGVATASACAWSVLAVRFAVAYQPATAPWATAVSTLGLAIVIVGGLAARTGARVRMPAAPPTEDEVACLDAVLRGLREDGIFRRTDLTLESFAALVGTTPHFLSRVVNERCGVSVPELVNRHRVEAAKVELRDPHRRQEPVHAIAASVGFTSRSAFNAAFRKHCGLTPTEFRDERRTDS